MITDPFEEYLIENKQRNRGADQYKLSKINKAAETFDALETTEPNDVTLDLLAEESSNAFAISGTKSKSPNVVENARSELTSESTADREGLVVVQKVGKKLQCRSCGYSWTFFGRMSRYYSGCPRCHTSVRIKPIKRKSFKGDRV